jgi:hypothetical protein
VCGQNITFQGEASVGTPLACDCRSAAPHSEAMSQRTVERVVGRLITDEEFRLEFTRRPAQILAALVEQGWELTAIEVDALVQTDTRLWSDGARRINPRLQRCSLKTSEENIRSSS